VNKGKKNGECALRGKNVSVCVEEKEEAIVRSLKKWGKTERQGEGGERVVQMEKSSREDRAQNYLEKNIIAGQREKAKGQGAPTVRVR